jgi:selenocysteine-specific elongation factor
LKNRTRVRFHTGTIEVFGIVVLLDQEELQPGETTVAQLRLDTPVAVIKDDRYVIRSYSPVFTIGGGAILNPVPKKHKRFNDSISRGLRRLAEGTAEDVIAFQAIEAGYRGLSFTQLRLMTNLTSKQLDGVLQGLLSNRILIQIDKENRIYVHGDVVAGLKTAIAEQLGTYHHDNPLKAGMPKEELRSKFSALQSGRLLNLILNQLVKEETIAQHENVIRLADHKVSLAADQNDLRRKILDTYRQGGLTPPYFKDVQRQLGGAGADARSVLDLLVEDGRIVKVKEELFFDQTAVDRLKRKLVDFLTENSEITTPQFKDLAGVSRKYLIPLIEYYDAQNVTLRVGDVRKLRKG